MTTKPLTVRKEAPSMTFVRKLAALVAALAFLVLPAVALASHEAGHQDKPKPQFVEQAKNLANDVLDIVKYGAPTVSGSALGISFLVRMLAGEDEHRKQAANRWMTNSLVGLGGSLAASGIVAWVQGYFV